jgi:hypothetical protein
MNKPNDKSEAHNSEAGREETNIANAKTKQTTDETVGFGRPPLHSRFKRGQSGNPRGRPKNSKNFTTIVQDVLTQRITIREGNQRRSITRLEGVVLRQVDDALKGNDRAALATLKIAAQVGLLGKRETPPESPSLTPADEQILEKVRTLLQRDNDGQS